MTAGDMVEVAQKTASLLRTFGVEAHAGFKPPSVLVALDPYRLERLLDATDVDHVKLTSELLFMVKHYRAVLPIALGKTDPPPP